MFQSKNQWEKLHSMEIIKRILLNENKALEVASSAGHPMGQEPFQALFG